MLIDDFTLMCRGFWKKERHHESIFRNVAWIIHASFVNKAIPINVLWPIGERDKPMTQEQLNKRSEEIMKRVELTNKLLEEKEKMYARAVKNSN